MGKTSSQLQPGLHKLDDNRHLLVLPLIVDVLPMTYPEVSRRLVQLIIKRTLSKSFAKLAWSEPVLVAYWWMFPELTAGKIWRFRIFDVIDRHWGYAYEKNDKIRNRNFALAVETGRAANKVLAVSESLTAELADQVSVDVLPNAIDLSRVAGVVSRYPKTRMRTAVYAGGWNERLDVNLLLKLVERNPTWNFHFLGASADSRFVDFDNVRFFGDVSYDIVISELSQAQIGLVPFVSNAYTESSNLLKVLDYLATGVVIGSTKLVSLTPWADKYPSRFKLLGSLDEWDSFFASAEDLCETEDHAYAEPDMMQYSTASRARALVSSPGVVDAPVFPDRDAANTRRAKLD
ncbi:hypothetical protein [Arthrobacter sp. NQ4]|uniref:hypothetical protein n=1 Tax=Arthrobacter sp. NQ4 TaxID=3027930 RepID=UPI0023B198B7|nr:hypothetical protein [Arthrobacter sp. NQ4]MDE8585924.1 hypothetical protein [Arthrobacter sp. NQ4]